MGVLYCFNVLLFAVATYAIYFNCAAAPWPDNSDPGVNGLDGQSLINLGRKLKKPALTIIGMALNEFHICSKWTQWSPCVAVRRGFFGTRSRQRKCRQKSEISEKEDERQIENELGLCEGICPLNYTVTKNGFCLQLYETKKLQVDAKKHCLEDGGNLIHVDSDRKHQDVKTLLQGLAEQIFIDGQRKDVDSPWRFSYGSPKRHLEWATGQPDDAAISLCLRLDDDESRLLHDVTCDIKLQFACEIS